MPPEPTLPPTIETLRVQRDEILAIAAQYGAFDVRIFGSVARGESTPGSDVDLLVSFRKGASLYDLSGLTQALSAFLQHRVAIISDHPRLRERLRQRLLQDAVPL
jgi:predicted nucleotidyltransferase